MIVFVAWNSQRVLITQNIISKIEKGMKRVLDLQAAYRLNLNKKNIFFYPLASCTLSTIYFPHFDYHCPREVGTKKVFVILNRVRAVALQKFVKGSSGLFLLT
ncbi:hypothetical protein BpHYR1_044200 [Brachionus plicatilis]|uniref:Uncharacterized protein n=1 Tax=Brachionus plicatilis TaxID=10195 RepID=A0A3M7PAL7_BRAPC|nr:hypothetical protein BpHYR1_044200 [Brachionus plicatilis]